MNNFDIDIEWASKMLSSEIGTYLFSLWNGDDDEIGNVKTGEPVYRLDLVES